MNCMIRSLLCYRSPVTIHAALRATFCSGPGNRKIEGPGKGYGVTTEHSVKGKKLVEAWQGITIEELAKQMFRSVDDIEEVMIIRNIEDLSDFRDVVTVCYTLGYRCNQIKNPHTPPSHTKQAQLLKQQEKVVLIPRVGKLIKSRPPVVTIMGHVDHGKTTLLDQLRQSEIVKSEFGGITQHIGAFVVSLDDPKANNKSAKPQTVPPVPALKIVKPPDSQNLVTFLDTPGHAAFHNMRQRGANVTDIVVLVVAAEDGVMNQTIESINFAKEANVPIVVAINKIDKINMRDPRALDHVKNGLYSHGIIFEEDGGDTQVVKISALEGIGIEELKETIIALSETLNLKAAVDGDVTANVIESSISPTKGRLATLLVRSGTLEKGDLIVSTSEYSTAWAKVRAMFNEFGQMMERVTPGLPVQVIGWRDDLIPDAGDQMVSVENEKKAKEYVKFRNNERKIQKALQDFEEGSKRYESLHQEYLQHLKEREEKSVENPRVKYHRHMTSQDLVKIHTEYDPENKTIHIILKCDVKGSLEVLSDVLSSYPNDREYVQVELIQTGIGPVTQSDLELASIFKNTYIYAFNVQNSDELKAAAKENGVIIKEHNVIYHLVNDVKSEIDKLLPLLDREVIVGEGIVQQEFMVSELIGNKKTPVAGSKCSKGTLKKGDKYLYRIVKAKGGLVIDNLQLVSMRHVKDEVDTIRKEMECGLKFDLTQVKSSHPDFKFEPLDKIVCYQIEKVPQKTKWTPDGF